jgi:hypothetical protein
MCMARGVSSPGAHLQLVRLPAPMVVSSEWQAKELCSERLRRAGAERAARRAARAAWRGGWRPRRALARQLLCG